MREKAEKGRGINREMALVTYLFIILFLIMAGYLIYFVVMDSDTVLNTSPDICLHGDR